MSLEFGNGFSINGGGGSYTLPPATASTLGGVMSDESTIHVDSTGVISTVNMVKSTDITNIVKCTQSEYDALVSGGTVDSNTFYIIIPASNS